MLEQKETIYDQYKAIAKLLQYCFKQEKVKIKTWANKHSSLILSDVINCYDRRGDKLIAAIRSYDQAEPVFFLHSVFSVNMSLTEILSSKCFGGYQKIFSFFSSELQCDTRFAIYLPPEAEKSKVPVLYYLSGMKNNEEDFIHRSGAQRYAAEHGICIVCPDTSPRNVDIPGQDINDAIGYGAGFYLDATTSPWCKHYKMFSYVTSELIKVVNKNFPVIPNKQSIFGSSMGGHGSLICALKNPGLYCSVSALSPVANIVKAPLSEKILSTYLGDNEEEWNIWDATELVAAYNGVPIEIFIDQGTDDEFYKMKALLPENFVQAAAKNDRVQCIYKTRDGYDHDYFFIASVVEEHIKYHCTFLKC